MESLTKRFENVFMEANRDQETADIMGAYLDTYWKNQTDIYLTLFKKDTAILLNVTGINPPSYVLPNLNVYPGKFAQNIHSLPSCPDFHERFYWNFMAVYKFFIAPFLLVLGFIGNLLGAIFLLRLKKKTLRDKAFFYMILFSFSYCVFYALWLFERVRHVVFTNFSLNEAWVKFVAHYLLIFMKSSSKACVFSLLLLLVDQYVLVKYPFKYKKFQERKFLTWLPIFFWILAVSLCTSSYFWYEVGACRDVVFSSDKASFKKRFITNNEYDLAQWIYPNGTALFKLWFVYKMHEPLWLFYYDIFREIVVSIIPGLVILYLGLYITVYLIRFLNKRKKNKARIVPAIQQTQHFHQSSSTANPLKDKPRIIPPNIRESNATTTSGMEMDSALLAAKAFNIPTGPDKSHADIQPSLTECPPSSSRLTRSQGFLRNASCIIFFILYLICQIPSLISVVMRQHLENIRHHTPIEVDKLIESGHNLEFIFSITVFYIILALDKRFQRHIFKICNLKRRG